MVVTSLGLNASSVLLKYIGDIICKVGIHISILYTMDYYCISVWLMKRLLSFLQKNNVTIHGRHGDVT